MLFVHAADLHLGKTLHERDLLEEQEAMLDDLLRILVERKPAGLLIAGDLYDRAIPSPEAIGLLDRFLSRAVESAPDTTIIAISGNHDSASRLSFGSGLFRKAGVHLRSRPSESFDPIIVEARAASGEVERCAVWALPFLGGGAALDIPSSGESGRGDAGFGDAGSGDAERDGRAAVEAPRGQAALFSAAIERIEGRLLSESYNVLLAHCFATGGMPSDSERAFVGLAEEVDARLFDRFDYAALGHLHRPQAAGSKGRYAGAPLAYSFGEARRFGASGGGAEVERGFLLVELGKGEAKTEFLPHRPLRRLVRVEARFAELLGSETYRELREDYIEACLLDEEPVLDPAERLKTAFPRLLSIRQSAFETRLGGTTSEEGEDGGFDADRRSPDDPGLVVEEFSAFYREMRGEAPDEATAGLFRSLVEEAAREAD